MVKTKKENGKIDKLARMVQRGFEDSDKRLDKITVDMNHGFSAINGRIDKFQDEVNYRFDKIEQILFIELKDRVEKLEEVVFGRQRK